MPFIWLPVSTITSWDYRRIKMVASRWLLCDLSTVVCSLRLLHICVFLVLSGQLQLMVSEVRALPCVSHPIPHHPVVMSWPIKHCHLCSHLFHGLGCAVITFEWQDNRMQVYTAPQLQPPDTLPKAKNSRAQRWCREQSLWLVPWDSYNLLLLLCKLI